MKFKAAEFIIREFPKRVEDKEDKYAANIVAAVNRKRPRAYNLIQDLSLFLL